MGNSHRRHLKSGDIPQRTRVRSRIETMYGELPDYHDDFSRRCGSKVKVPYRAKRDAQAAYEDFIDEAARDVEIGLTLTFRDSALKMGSISARLNVEKTLLHFVNRLNKAAFGHGVKRRKQSLTVIPVIEGEGSHKRLHAHIGISRPRHIGLETWMGTVLREAKQCKQVAREMKVKAVDSGWLRYVTKEGIEALALDSMKLGRP